MSKASRPTDSDRVGVSVASPTQEQLLSSLPLPDDEWTRAAIARGMPVAIAMKLPHLPDAPGVYLWKAADGTVLYVGKAKRLRSRVRSYWNQEHEANPKTRGLLRKAQQAEGGPTARPLLRRPARITRG